MIEPIKYKCKNCGMIFFKHSNNLGNGKKGLTCPYCESQSWMPLITK